MKKVILLALLFISVRSFSQENKVSGFAGLKFKTSKADAIKYLTQRFNQKPTESSNVLMLSSVKVGREEAKSIAFMFMDDMYFGSYAKYTADPSSSILDLYNRIHDNIILKYESPKADDEIYTYPYVKGDGNYEQAISSGKLKRMSLWLLKADDNQDCNIREKIDTNYNVILTYYYEPLSKKRLNEIKKKEFADF